MWTNPQTSKIHTSITLQIRWNLWLHGRSWVKYPFKNEYNNQDLPLSSILLHEDQIQLPSKLCFPSTMGWKQKNEDERFDYNWRSYEGKRENYYAPRCVKKFGPFLDLCVSSLRRGHANLLCIVPILSDVPEGTKIIPFSADIYKSIYFRCLCMWDK